MKSKITNLKSKIRTGATLVELMMSIIISLIIILAVSISMVDSQKAWGKMYGEVFSDVAVESVVAAKRFDAMVRKASDQTVSVDPSGQWVEVYYYASSTSVDPDRYAKFYFQDGQLVLDWGNREPKETLGLEILCHNVIDGTFRSVGRSVQMLFTLDDDNTSLTVASSALMNN